MGSKLTIRIATLDDDVAVSDVLGASYTALMPSKYDATVLTAALPIITPANPLLLTSGTYYIAESEAGQTVGCGGWTLERPETTDIAPNLAHIRHFATHPEWGGRGIGRLIYERCVEDARAVGVRRFECYSSLNAEGFYAAMGFVPVEAVEIDMGVDVTFPSILMTVDI